MERIQVTRIKDIYELFSFLQHLKISLHHDQDGHHSVRIIILDSLPVLFFPFLGKNLNDGKISPFFIARESLLMCFLHCFISDDTSDFRPGTYESAS